MKKHLISILLALILGYICASFILEEYKASSDDTTIYYLVASNNISISNMKQVKENNRYYTYIGITSNKENASKIKKLYSDNNINLYIRESSIDNKGFIYDLVEYDVLLSSTNNKEEIDKILEAILTSYEDNVLKRS